MVFCALRELRSTLLRCAHEGENVSVEDHDNVLYWISRLLSYDGVARGTVLQFTATFSLFALRLVLATLTIYAYINKEVHEFVKGKF
jgi:hypothetical protein